MLDDTTPQDREDTDAENAEDDNAPDQMSDVDHSHPDSDETFTETGVYDRGRKHRAETEDKSDSADG